MEQLSEGGFESRALNHSIFTEADSMEEMLYLKFAKTKYYKSFSSSGYSFKYYF